MKLKIALAGIITASATLAGCESAANTNTAANRAANGNLAVVVNSNNPATNSNSVSPITTTNTNSRSSINYNGTAKENEAQRTSVESQAKSAGDTIGQGAEDWWLYGKTRAALAANTSLTSSTTFKVDVANNVVTLTGAVNKQSDIAEVEKTVKGISGVKGVQNKLKVDANATTLGGTNTNSNANKK